MKDNGKQLGTCGMKSTGKEFGLFKRSLLLEMSWFTMAIERSSGESSRD